MQISIEKRHLFIILAVIIFLAGTILVFGANPTTKPNPGHYSNETMININGVDKTLQQAIDDGDFNQIKDAPGTLCGLYMQDGGAYNFACQGHNPSVSCPSGYTKRCGSVSSPDNTCVCIKD